MTDGPRDSGWANTVYLKHPNAFAVSAALATGVNASCLYPRDAFAQLLLDEVPFHLSEHAKHGQNDMTHFPAYRDMWVEHSEERPVLLCLLGQIEHIPGVVPRSVEASDNQFIARQ